MQELVDMQASQISLLSGNMAEMYDPEKLIQSISFDKIKYVSTLKDGRFRFIFQGMKGYREMSSHSFESTNKQRAIIERNYEIDTTLSKSSSKKHEDKLS